MPDAQYIYPINGSHFHFITVTVIYLVRSQGSDCYLNHWLESMEVLKFLFCLFTNSFARWYLLSLFRMSGTMLCAGDTLANKAGVPILVEPIGKADSEQICQHSQHGKTGSSYLFCWVREEDTLAEGCLS